MNNLKEIKDVTQNHKLVNKNKTADSKKNYHGKEKVQSDRQW
jgi:hypothetical protein